MEALIIVKSIMYDIGLMNPEYLPFLNLFNLNLLYESCYTSATLTPT